MPDRRRFILGAAAVCAPALVSAQEGFELAGEYRAQVVRVRPDFAPGEIHIELARHFLYLIVEPERAIRYGVAIGSEGRNLSGSVTVERKVEWPSWTPTANMIRREPHIYKKWAGGMEGGPDNPLGARALYLYRGGRDTRYRIHGTPQPWTIGRSVSSGCIRLENAQVIDLYERVPLGTRVTFH